VKDKAMTEDKVAQQKRMAEALIQNNEALYNRLREFDLKEDADVSINDFLKGIIGTRANSMACSKDSIRSEGIGGFSIREKYLVSFKWSLWIRKQSRCNRCSEYHCQRKHCVLSISLSHWGQPDGPHLEHQILSRMTNDRQQR
jgi:hypothetical protein